MTGNQSVPSLKRVTDLDRLRQILAENLPWSPRDFVPKISKAGDRKLLAEEWTRSLPDSDDLRFVHSLASGEPIVIIAERLPWDSEFFGMGVAKLHAVLAASPPLIRNTEDYRRALELFLDECRRANTRYLFAPVDPRDLALLRALGELGFVLIETRFYHHGPVEPRQFQERLPVRRATEADIPSLTRAAAMTRNEFDRFHADPFLPRRDVDRLMVRWVEESVAGRMADVVIVPDTPNPTAFVAYRYHRARWSAWNVALAQGVLSAVSQEFMGWMGKLSPEVLHHLQSAGVEHVFGSTQAANTPILWFAEEQGAGFGRIELIFRKVL